MEDGALIREFEPGEWSEPAEEFGSRKGRKLLYFEVLGKRSKGIRIDVAGQTQHLWGSGGTDRGPVGKEGK